jgi:hypothetical protein
MRPNGPVSGGFDAGSGDEDIDIPNPGGALHPPGPFAPGGIGSRGGFAVDVLLGEKRNAAGENESGE